MELLLTVLTYNSQEDILLNDYCLKYFCYNCRMGISSTGAILETAILSEMLKLSGGNFNRTIHRVYTKNDFRDLLKEYGFNWENDFWFGLEQLSDSEIREQNGGVGLVKLEGCDEESYIWVTSQKDGKRIIHTPNIGVHFIDRFHAYSEDLWSGDNDFSKGWGLLYVNAVKVWEAANGSSYIEHEARTLSEEKERREKNYQLWLASGGREFEREFWSDPEGFDSDSNTSQEQDIPF